MHIVESSPVKFVISVVDAFQNGWKLKPEANEGHPSFAFLSEIKLFKGYSVEVIPDTRQQVVVSEYDAMDFLKCVYNAVANGFELDVNSIYWDSVGKKSCILNNPNYIEIKHYTKKELEDMDWTDLKKTGRMYGHGGRDRNLLINRILESQKEK